MYRQNDGQTYRQTNAILQFYNLSKFKTMISTNYTTYTVLVKNQCGALVPVIKQQLHSFH